MKVLPNSPASNSIRTSSPILGTLLNPYSRLGTDFGDLAAYRSLHTQAQHLVSLVDELGKTKDPEVLTLRYEGKAMGVVSFIVETNPKRPAPRRKYARIDLVISHPVFRGYGVGRLLVLLLLAHLLERQGSELYSISCLAAHPAIEHILESLGFAPREQPQRVFGQADYAHEEIRLDDRDTAVWLADIEARAATALRETNYRLRQNLNAARRW